MSETEIETRAKETIRTLEYIKLELNDCILAILKAEENIKDRIAEVKKLRAEK